MAGNYGDPLFLGAAPAGYSSSEFNKAGAFIGTGGIVNPGDLAPSGAGTTMTFQAGKCIIPGTDNPSAQGSYLCPLNATQTYTLPAGVASSGHERTDWLVAKVYDDPIATIAGGSDEWKIIAVPGSEAAVGASVPPSLSTTTTYIPVATVRVNSSGIQAVTDMRVRSNHPSILDGSGNVRFVDLTTSGQVISGSKRFTAGLARGNSGAVRGYNRIVATRTTTYSLPNINIATDAFSVVKFNFINANTCDDGIRYDSTTGIITLDGPASVSGEVSIKCPGGYGGVRLVTGTGIVVYQLVLAQTNSPFDFLSLPFSFCDDYSGTMTVQAGQQSSAAQTQPANDNANNPVVLRILGV